MTVSYLSDPARPRFGFRRSTLLLVGTILSVAAVPAWAQQHGRSDGATRQGPDITSQLLTPPPPPPVTGPVQGDIIRTLNVEGAQRIEPETVLSYVKLRVGQPYSREAADQAITDLFATELFADVQIRNESGVVTISVRENPIVNRVIFEGNRSIKDDKLNKELKLSPRQIFTRSKVRAEISRIIELYQRQGRFGASVEPKMIQLDQNRVDIIYEITEGPKSRIRQINVIGNQVFSDNTIRKQMVTHKASLMKFFSTTDTYDPDRLAYDQSKLRQFYLTKGYADFRVVSAVAELTPDRRDFIITYVIEEGPRYKFGDVTVESEIRDLRPDTIKALLPMKSGEWYNAKLLEDTMDRVTNTAGLLGYAFAEVDPVIERNPENLTMNVTFRVGETPRVYVESVNINGNTVTRDKVIRREFRIAEGDPFNAVAVRRSTERIQSLGYFQENFEVSQRQAGTPDRIILDANIEEKQYGSLEFSAGYSSEERFVLQAGITQRNFRGMGQEVGLSGSFSKYSRGVSLNFTEPYFRDKNIAAGVTLFANEYKSFDYGSSGRDQSYRNLNYGVQFRSGIALTEYWSAAFRYGLSRDHTFLSKKRYYSDDKCDPYLAGVYLCDAIGNRIISSAGYSLYYDRLNNRARPTSGYRFAWNQDFAGLGGAVKYFKTAADAARFWDLGSQFILKVSLEGGYIIPWNKKRKSGDDRVRITDRFFLGQPEMRGFSIRGIGPRVVRRKLMFDADGKPQLDANGNQIEGERLSDDALGGRGYYLGHLELELPLGSAVRNLGIRPSLYMDAGAVFNLKRPVTITSEKGRLYCKNDDGDKKDQNVLSPGTTCPTGTTEYFVMPPFKETYYGNSASPRLSVGIGFNWNSPFGPFRFDIAKALLKKRGDRTQVFTFNVGTNF